MIIKGNILKLLFIFGLTSFSFHDITFARATYKNPSEWVKETLAHKARIIQYANKLQPHLVELHDHWDYFIKYLELHDNPKVMSLEELLAVAPNYNHSQPISVRMAAFYGLDVKDMSPKQKEDFFATRDDLNYIESLLKENFKKTLPLGTPDFTEIELILDWTDTTIFRLEELNIDSNNANLYLAVERFSQRGMPEMAQKARSIIDILQSYLTILLDWKKQTSTLIFTLLTMRQDPISSPGTTNLCNFLLN